MRNQTALTSFRYSSNGISYFPVVPIVFPLRKKTIRSLALIDSGATISIFTTETVKLLGIDIESGKKIVLGGIGGRIVGYTHTLLVRIAGKTFFCPIVFSREYPISFNLLGRDAFFEQFTIIFQESNHLVRLENPKE